MAEYRIEFTITLRKFGEDDFREVGFGSSGAWTDLDACAHAVTSQVQNGQWETEDGSAEKHVARCFSNPAVRSCKTCRWFSVERAEPEVGIFNDDFQCQADDAIDLNIDRCATCGGIVYPDGSGECECGYAIGKPIIGLRVKCPAWTQQGDNHA